DVRLYVRAEVGVGSIGAAALTVPTPRILEEGRLVQRRAAEDREALCVGLQKPGQEFVRAIVEVTLSVGVPREARTGAGGLTGITPEIGLVRLRERERHLLVVILGVHHDPGPDLPAV